MSKKARLRRKLRRKMQAVWRDSGLQKDLEQSFCDFLCFGVTGIVEDKDGNVRTATPNEIEEVLSNGQIIRKAEIRFDAVEKKFRQARRLKYNLLDMEPYNEQDK